MSCDDLWHGVEAVAIISVVVLALVGAYKMGKLLGRDEGWLLGFEAARAIVDKNRSKS